MSYRVGRILVLVCLLAGLFLSPLSSADTLDFAGRTWHIREWTGAPGPNYWSTNCVWVDTNDWLHLQIKNISGTWYCGEVQTTNTLGYGKYRWYVVNRVGDMDTNAVGGLFTYEYFPDDENEIDFEFTKSFTDDDITNLHYTVQPYYTPGNTRQSAMAFTNENTTHQFVWTPGHIQWQSWYGHTPEPVSTNLIIDDWTYTGSSVPLHQDEKVYMNLWLFLGEVPTETNKLEMIIKDFTYIASTGTVIFDEFDDGTMGSIWATFGDTGGNGLVETNDMLRINPVDSDYTALGYYTTNMISWANDGLQYVYSASLRTVDVSAASTNGDLDMHSIQGLFSGPGISYDAFWSSNAITLKGGYDEATDSLQVDLYTKTNWITSWGYLRFSGVITNLAAYGDTNGLELQFVLEATNYYVRAFHLTNAVPIATNSGSASGLHALGSALNQGYYQIGAQNDAAGRGYLYWNKTHVYTLPGTSTSAAPPVVTNEPNVVQVGSNSAAWNYPINTAQKKSRAQLLYFGDQIDYSGTITQLEIDVAGYPRIPLLGYTIRMQHTSLTNLDDQWVSGGWTTVYDASTTISNVGWYPFQLTTPFDYDKTNNLLIDFSINGTSRERYPYGYARYSVGGAANQCLGRTAKVNTDPVTWTGTDPGTGDEVLNNRYVNLRLVFEPSTSSPPFATFGFVDEFNDTSTSNIWGLTGWWDSAEKEEANGLLRIKPGVNAWQTTGYITTQPMSWNDTSVWFAFSAELSTIKVDVVRSGEDVQSVIALCSEQNNAWWVTNSASLQGQYDEAIDKLDLVFYTKTASPQSDGTERFNGSLTNVSRYLSGSNGLQMVVVVGQTEYALTFADEIGRAVPVLTNSGAMTGSHNLGAVLHDCYWMVGVQNVDTGRGSVFYNRTAVFSSTPPAIVSYSAGQTSTDGQGLVTITSGVFDVEGNLSRLRVEASTNGGVSWFHPWVDGVSGTYSASVVPSEEAYPVLQIVTTDGGGDPATNELTLTWSTKNAGNGADLAASSVTGLVVKLIPDDLAMSGPAVTTSVFDLDNAAPARTGASVQVEGGVAYTFDAPLDVSWSSFTDEGAGLDGYYFSLSDAGGTTNGVWTTDQSGQATGAVPDAANAVFVWASDVFGNLGLATSDSVVVLSAAGDWDNDKLTNNMESGYGCDPLSADSDGDVMSDGWEVMYGLDPTSGVDAAEHGDADRYPNQDEFYWDTDPTDSNSYFRFWPGLGSGDPTVGWGTSTTRTYSLYYAEGAYSNDAAWSGVPSWTGLQGSGSTMVYTDEAVSVQRVYRVGVRVAE